MTISLSIQKILYRFGIAITALVFLAACALRSAEKPAAFRLPIEAVNSRSGTIMSFRTHATSGLLYVAGRARPHQLIRPAHVDVQLIGADGSIIAEQSDALGTPYHPQTAHGRRGDQSYVASFLLSELQRAVKIRVVYHRGEHRDDNS